MPSTPTTKSQVQAHHFVLRRMQSALVRKDAVMLHDPMRTHSRATMVGVIIAALGLLGFLVFGLISPKGGALEGESIVMSKESGSVYVATGNPIKLIPTFNVASARLLMAAQKEQQSKGGEGAGSLDFGGDEAVEPKLVSDDELAGVPKGSLTGIPGAPHMLPDAEQQISENWAVCDKTEINEYKENPNTGKITTTVLGGLSSPGRELGNNQALLARTEDNKVFLIYRAPKDRISGTANVVRAEVDLNDQAAIETFGLDPSQLRTISNGMLNAIPQVSPLTAPQIPGAGQGQSIPQMPDMQVGNVIRTNEAGGGLNYYVLLQDGKQRVSEAVAQLIVTTYEQGTTDIQEKEPAAVANVPNTQSPLNLGSYPNEVPEVLMAQAAPTACLGWHLEGEGPNRQGVTSVFVGADLPKDEEGNKLKPVKVNQPNADGTKIDGFYMPRNKGAVVRGTTSRGSFDSGPIYLVADNGIKYGVPDTKTAKILGLEPQKPAPDSIVRLLPNGANLNTQDVLQTYDGVDMTSSGSAGFDAGAQSGG